MIQLTVMQKYRWNLVCRNIRAAMADVANAPPLNNAAAAPTPKCPAIQGIAIAHIAHVDNPLLLCLIKTVELVPEVQFGALV